MTTILEPSLAQVLPRSLPFEKRRTHWIDISEEMPAPLSAQELMAFETVDMIYRSLCAMMYNYVPTSGHPGGSISSGRFVAALLFDAMDYDFFDPLSENADIISYAAGHKAMGLYSMWALRNEIMRIAAPGSMPDVKYQLRLEDLLGFRRNPAGPAPLAKSYGSKPLDGHPTPATPFVRLSTGASGVGLASSIGLAYAAADCFPDDPPRVHIVEGEGGLTPGRVAEALAAAGTASLGNVIVHLDWNQASIDSERVTREGSERGDYVQWTPAELFYLNDWNVIQVPDGTSFQQIVAAQRAALAIDNGQPTAIVYRTTKGWRYGIEGRASHGAGHRLCAIGFYEALKPLIDESPQSLLPFCDPANSRCGAGTNSAVVERCFWEALSTVTMVLEGNGNVVKRMAERVEAARDRLRNRDRRIAQSAPNLKRLPTLVKTNETPSSLLLSPGEMTTLRGQLGKLLGYLNRETNGGFFIASADLLGSTSISEAASAFERGYFNTRTNPGSRTLSTGGICEDAMTGILSGISAFGYHIGIGSSYAAFIAPLGHIAARLHAIGNQARQVIDPGAYRPFIMVCGHAGLKTGEDGPTHADPQPLQLLQENFPRGTMVTLTPWEPQELWPLMVAALRSQPAVIAPFVSRPSEIVPDRNVLGLAPASSAASGVYKLRTANGKSDGAVVLQESGVAYAFIDQTLPLLMDNGIDLDVYYVASAELFDLLSYDEQNAIYPESVAMRAMGFTGFTMPTMYRWIRSDLGRAMTLHPFSHGRYPGSGPGERVIAEAGLDGDGQLAAIRTYLEKLPRVA